MSYNNLLSFGDVIELRLQCNTSKCLDNIRKFQWKQYNPRKNINRYGLSVTSSDGTMNGIDLDSIAEYNKENNTKYNESSFKTFTEVYHKCGETQKLVEPFKPWLWRTHFLNFKKGGYFPPHIDSYRFNEQKFLRLLVPIQKCNPSWLYFMYEDKLLNFNRGYTYFLNTNKKHAIFSFNDESIMLVMNIKICKESVKKIHELMMWK